MAPSLWAWCSKSCFYLALCLYLCVWLGEPRGTVATEAAAINRTGTLVVWTLLESGQVAVCWVLPISTFFPPCPAPPHPRCSQSWKSWSNCQHFQATCPKSNTAQQFLKQLHPRALGHNAKSSCNVRQYKHSCWRWAIKTPSLPFFYPIFLTSWSQSKFKHLL